MDKRLNITVPGPLPQAAAHDFRSGAESLSETNASVRSPTLVFVSPNEGYRSQLKRAVELEGGKVSAVHNVYPGYADLPSLLEQTCDGYLVEIDSDQSVALDLVETICSRKPSTTVMVYSA